MTMPKYRVTITTIVEYELSTPTETVYPDCTTIEEMIEEDRKLIADYPKIVMVE